MDRELTLWIGGAVLTMVLAVVGTGVAVSGNMNAQSSDVRADIRQIRDSVDRLDRRLDDVEKRDHGYAGQDRPAPARTSRGLTPRRV